MKKLFAYCCSFLFFVMCANAQQTSWIRINQLGYTTTGAKVAVWCSMDTAAIHEWYLVDAATNKPVLKDKASKAYGAYGPFAQTCRLNFSSYKKPGKYFLKAANTNSPVFEIGDEVYKGTADFCLRYMRQQRSGFNPFLKDSCHTHDGYVLYGEKAGIHDSTYVDVVGGWHDASDYLQYATTSANATYHLLMSYRDFPQVFSDVKLANGLDGKNNLPDVLDEAKWGISWLLKMFPQSNIMFNQIGDDRDHMGMRIPKEDSNFYGRGLERPVYFLSGEPQQRGKFMNNTTGTASTAAKFASVFALAHYLYETDSLFRKADAHKGYYEKAFEAWQYAQEKPGVAQTASVRSPYIYAEDNWVDDMELASASIHDMVTHSPQAADNGYYLLTSLGYAKKEMITPWMGQDTAKHYQWYPFINIGHYELAKALLSKKFGTKVGYTPNKVKTIWSEADTLINYYLQGINAVATKAKQNAFNRGVPFIWCSNNLTVAFAMQCYWYKQLSGNTQFDELEQANFDWLFGCNPWGTSMVYGLPDGGDFPSDPHSAFTHLKNYPIDGGLVDGPVYGSIYKNLIGITLYQPDEYAFFQSDIAVYHDDYGDYSTNEPTMDGTASLIYLLAAKEAAAGPIRKAVSNQSVNTISHGAIIRGDSTKKQLAIVFTGDEFADGTTAITNTLQQQNVKATFFFTGRFLSNPDVKSQVKQLKNEGHYIGAHSNRHLLYCDWNKRDSLLVTKQQFISDLQNSYKELSAIGIPKKKATYFLPPYEWYNDSIALWTKQMGLQLINFTPGTKSNADYTTPDMKNYRSSDEIYQSIVDYEASKPAGLNGFILLLHIGTDNKRTDKFYNRLNDLIIFLQQKGYALKRVDELLR